MPKFRVSAQFMVWTEDEKTFAAKDEDQAKEMMANELMNDHGAEGIIMEAKKVK